MIGGSIPGAGRSGRIPTGLTLRPKDRMAKLPRLRDSGNRLLDHLPHDEFDRLAPALQRIRMDQKQVIHPYDAEVLHVYFPTTALVSLLTVLEEDDPVEAATVGREGFVGLAVALGVDASPHRVICQMEGDSLRVPIREFREALRTGPGLDRLVRRYVAYSLRATGQGIACNVLHTVESRACRWLLIVHDQARRDEFPMTQEFLAYMLGVRRQSVTVVAGTLQNAGLIRLPPGRRHRPRPAPPGGGGLRVLRPVQNYYDRVMS